MPLDIMALKSEVALPDPEPPSPPPPPDEELIAEAAKLLSAAKQPLIYIGSGCVEAGPEVLALAERLQVPVTTYTGGKGILSDKHYLAQNLLAGHELWRGTDVVLAVGTRFNQPQTRWGLDSEIKVIRIDLDPVEITRVARPTIGIVADAKQALAALNKELAAQERPSRQREFEELKAKTQARLEETLGPQCEYLAAIRAELPDDGIYVEDLTQVAYVGRLAFPAYAPRTYIHSGYQGTLGHCYATALGAKVARPDLPVVSISGDGGFMFTANEMATAVRHRIPLTAIVFNDGAFGNVRRIQQERFGNRLIASDLANPDFVKFAESFGAAGDRARTPEELRSALRRALARRDGPTLIDVPVGPFPSPWPYIFLPPVRGL
jgi:acetolactate synthase-1/2/3 large subunit